MPHYKVVYHHPDDDDPESDIVFSKNIEKRFTSMQQENPKVEFISYELIHLQDPKILDLLQKAGSLRAVQICKTLNLSSAKVYPALQRLKLQGLIQGHKQFPNQIVYRLTEIELTK
ncbi:winged helix-turn-helix domain-containing protein [Nostoc sp.]|uniref:winged helix-turn-helix domain-containing protein n=1 Tax=Nostoc sp. TaxID=1180 RepID=UPI002FF69974